MQRKSTKTIRKRISLNKHRRRRKEFCTLAEATSRYIRMKVGQPSVLQVVFGLASLDDNMYSCSLCGRSLSICTYYECMPHEVKLRERSERELTYRQRRREEKKQTEEFMEHFVKMRPQ